MPRVVYVNGSFVPEEEAKISIFDRGFLFADGVYEVTAVLDGGLIDFDGHVARLDRSLKELEMAWPVSPEQLLAVHHELIARNDVESGTVYMQVTRGVAERDFAYPEDTPTTLVAFTQSRELVDAPLAKSGVDAVTIPDIRWQRRDIKSIALLAPAMGKEYAKQQGAYEAWMVEDGFVTEGTSSNAYIVTDDSTVITRPLSNSILPGVTRAALLRLAQEDGVTIEERPFTPEEAYQAQEAFLTSSSTFVLPIVNLDHRPIGSGVPGPLTKRLRALYIETAREFFLDRPEKLRVSLA